MSKIIKGYQEMSDKMGTLAGIKHDPDRIISDYGEIKEVIDELDSVMHDPGIDEYKLTTMIVPEEELLKFLGMVNHGRDEGMKVKRFETVCLPLLDDLTHILIAPRPFYTIVPGIFHERGHASNRKLFRDLKANDLTNRGYSEALAFSYQLWCMSEMNRKGMGQKIESGLEGLVMYHMKFEGKPLNEQKAGIDIIYANLSETRSDDFGVMYWHIKNKVISGSFPSIEEIYGKQKGSP